MFCQASHQNTCNIHEYIWLVNSMDKQAFLQKICSNLVQYFLCFCIFQADLESLFKPAVCSIFSMMHSKLKNIDMILITFTSKFVNWMGKIVEKAERLNSLIALTCKTLSQLFYKNIKVPIESYLENFLNNSS